MTRRAKLSEPGAFDEGGVRNYWRSVIAHLCVHNAGLLGIVAIGTRELGALPPRVYVVAIPKCQRLIDELCLAEKTRGARRRDDEYYANTQLWSLLKLYTPLPPRPAAAGESGALALE